MGISLEQLFDKWENFCSTYEINYAPSDGSSVNVDEDEMCEMFNRTLSDFDYEMGYKRCSPVLLSKTTSRLLAGPLGPDTWDIWFKGPWRRGGWVLKEET